MQRFLLALLFCCTFLGGCSSEPKKAEQPLVLVSLAPQAYFVQRLTTEEREPLVRTEVMIPSSSSPELYEPTMNQLRIVSSAKLYLALGHPMFHFENTYVPRFLEQNKSLQLVRVLDPTLFDQDPHVWIAPNEIRHLVVGSAHALEQLLPDKRAVIEGNLAPLLREIDAPDQKVHNLLQGRKRNVFMVFHPGWHYFAKQYGLEQISLEEEGKEPDPRTLAEKIERARALGIKTIFVSPQFSRESAELVARAIGGRTRVINNLSYDWFANLEHVANAVREALDE